MRDLDPRGLIAEAYRMTDLDDASCRTLFLDWSLGLPDEVDVRRAAATMLARHGAAQPTHPMTGVLRAAQDDPPKGGRRGGARGRRT